MKKYKHNQKFVTKKELAQIILNKKHGTLVYYTDSLPITPLDLPEERNVVSPEKAKQIRNSYNTIDTKAQ